MVKRIRAGCCAVVLMISMLLISVCNTNAASDDLVLVHI